jgi:hypothetical protein
LIELVLAEYFNRRTGEVIFIPVGYFKAFDGISQSKQLCYETKFDARACETSNLCFEYSYKGKPSGIVATHAEKWVQVIPINKERMCCYQFSVDTLKEALKGLPTYSAGDGNQSRVKLLPREKAEHLSEQKFFICIKWDEIKPYW